MALANTTPSFHSAGDEEGGEGSVFSSLDGSATGGVLGLAGSDDSSSESDSEDAGDFVDEVEAKKVATAPKLSRRQRRAARRVASLRGLVFFRYVRVGEMSLNLHTKGFKMNPHGLGLRIPAVTVRQRLWTWRALFRR